MKTVPPAAAQFIFFSAGNSNPFAPGVIFFSFAFVVSALYDSAPSFPHR
jgi:hypothetical protein